MRVSPLAPRRRHRAAKRMPGEKGNTMRGIFSRAPKAALLRRELLKIDGRPVEVEPEAQSAAPAA